MRIRLYLAAMIATALLPATPAVAAWQEARSAHFTVYADDRADRVRDFATRLERFDRALNALFGIPDGINSSSRRLTVFVIGSAGSVGKLYGKGSRDVAGFYLPRATGAVAFVPRSSGSDLTAEIILLHEYAHHFSYLSWPNTPIPAWFSEGFAEFAATALFNKDGGVTIGSPPIYRAEEILNPTLTMKSLLTSNVASLPQDQRSELYGRGWLLTHYLILSNERRKLVTEYFEALNSGKDAADAAAVFGDSIALGRALDRYAAKSLTGFVIGPDRIRVGEVSVTALSPGAAAVMPARILSQRGVDAATAPAVYAMAAKLAAPYPNDPAAQNVLAEAAFDAKEFGVAEAAIDRALAADPKSVHALVYRGRIAMAEAVADKLPPKDWAAVRRHFVEANKIDTENAEPLLFYYETCGLSGVEPTKNAEASLIHAFEIAPFDPRLRLSVVALLLKRGDAPSARAALKPLAYNPHGGGLGKFANAVLAALDKDGAAAALAAMTATSAEDGDQD